MNCQEVQAQLSDYADRSLSAAQLVLVEEHFAACAPCREEAELLNESIRQVVALPALETPLGFTQRVMSHVREIETQPSFWQRFIPLSGKIPAQATALVIVAFLGIYLLQKEEPELGLPPAAETTNADGGLQQDGAPAPKGDYNAPEKAPTAQTERPQTRSATQTAVSTQREQSGATEERRRPVENPASIATSNLPRHSFSASPSAEPTVRATPVISGTPVFSAGSLQPGGSASTFPFPADAESIGSRAAPPAIEPFADFEVIVRRHRTPPTEPRDDAAAVLRKAEVSQNAADRPVTPRPIDRLMAAIPDHTRPQTIWINVLEDQYQEFKKELHALGIIESETRVPLLRDHAAGRADGHLRVKLTALPAGETATPNPATDR
jgi:hypothetical protein